MGSDKVVGAQESIGGAGVAFVGVPGLAVVKGTSDTGRTFAGVPIVDVELELRVVRGFSCGAWC